MPRKGRPVQPVFGMPRSFKGAVPMFSSARHWRSGVVAPLFVLVCGLMAAATGALWSQHRIDADAQAEFGRAVERVAAEVSRRFRQPIYGLNGAKGAYAAARKVDRAQFRAYVQARDLPREFPGVRGFGFIQHVPRKDLDAFVAAERADAAPQFAIRQLDDKGHDDLFVIKFIEPASRNAGAQGLDVGSEARRRAAALRAIDSGEPTMTAAITLVQDQRRLPGVLLYVPVFDTAARPTNADERRAALVGLLYAPIVIAELLDGLHDVASGQVGFELVDAAAGTAGVGIVYATDAPAAGVAGVAQPRPASRLQATRTLALPGRELALHVVSTPAFEGTISHAQPWLVLAAVSLVSGLLALLLWLQASGRERAEALARRMTADLDRLAQVVRHTSNAVSITDRELRITWINEGFTRISGYGLADALGRTPGELLGSGKAQPEQLKALADSAAAGVSCRMEILNRAKDGREYWIDTEIQPLRDGQGQVIGFMEIGSDVTERRRAQEQLETALRDNEALLRTLDMHAIVSVADAAGRITAANDAFCRISGFAREELLGQYHRIVNSGLHVPGFWDDMWRTIAGGTPWRGEVCNRAKDGSLYWVDTFIAPFRGADGQIDRYISIRTDITASKRSDAALRASQSFLDKAGRIGGVGGWALDLSTRQMQWTEQTCRIHDVEPGHQPTLDEALDHYTPQVRQTIEQAVRRSVLGGQGFDLELPSTTAKGRAIWVRASGEAELIDGKAVRLVGAFQDITERRLMEAELRRHNEVMTSVLESLPCGLSVFDAELNLVAANREFRRLLDFPDALFDGPGTRFEDIIRFNAARGEYGKGDLDAIVQGIVERARAPAAPHRFERVRPDGTPLEISGAPMPGGGFVTTYVDISARREAEAQIQRSAALLRGAIDAIDEAFVLYDPDDRLVFCNDKYREIYRTSADLIVPGASFEEILRAGAQRGQYAAAVGRVDEWVAERVAAHRAGNATLMQRLDDGRSLRIVERRMPDGHIVGFRIDISELVRATEAAEQASLAKSQFLANMSHEIRTPMNAILGMLKLLRKTELSPRQADYAGKTESAARSLLGLLNDILDFSKVEAGKMSLDPNPFRIDRLMRDLSVVLSASVGAKPVEVLFDIDPALPRHLVGDAMRLQQVLINLGGNAVKFTEQGEVVLSVAVVQRSDADVTLRFEVRDTGIGIAPENQARIFSGFTQAEASTTRRFGGTGLGVAISQRMVSLMGGELELDSALGRGSRFHFCITLPMTPDGPDEQPAARLPAQRWRVLVVDDNATAREVLQRMGQSLGWAVDVADSGERARALLQSSDADGLAYQAVFLDWQMPGLDGWATSRRIRELGLGDAAPVVVMVTAHGREEMSRRSDAEQGLLDGFLVKPVTASMLFDAVMDARGGKGHLPAARAQATGARRLPAMRLLVVEDNPNNQQVARELLEDEGAIVQIANDGQEAVDAVAAAQPPFDVVLMDLQMPVMDGLTATRHIRTELGLQTLPIVAMTANAMASDREACLAAGMNAHVGKPFDLDELVGLLRRLAGLPPALDEPGAAAVSALPAPLSEAAQAAGVELAAALHRLGGREDVYRRMLRGFMGELAGMPEQLRTLVAQGELLPAARLLHTLKGLAATLGIKALADAAAEAEKRLAAASAPADASTAIGLACQAIDLAGTGLDGLLQALQGTEQSTASNALDAQALAGALQELAGHLQNADMKATDAMASLQRDFGASLGEPLGRLDEAVGALDFELALQLCNELIGTQTG
jgi:two-component system, sensor histidine kinase and response regulator